MQKGNSPIPAKSIYGDRVTVEAIRAMESKATREYCKAQRDTPSRLDTKKK